jgi:hypothetical protein
VDFKPLLVIEKSDGFFQKGHRNLAVLGGSFYSAFEPLT